jgi:hypothetical protein
MLNRLSVFFGCGDSLFIRQPRDMKRAMRPAASLVMQDYHRLDTVRPDFQRVFKSNDAARCFSI